MDRPGTRNSGSKGEGRLVNQFSQPFPLRILPLLSCVLVEWRASISTALNKTRTEIQEEILEETLRHSVVPRHTVMPFVTAVVWRSWFAVCYFVVRLTTAVTMRIDSGETDTATIDAQVYLPQTNHVVYYVCRRQHLSCKMLIVQPVVFS
jgi:hypothetical protein